MVRTLLSAVIAAIAAGQLFTLADSAHGATPTPAQACRSLAGMAIAPSAIGLPTAGARVEAATLVPAAGRQPEYCRVTGRVLPVDPAAFAFQFAVGLPDRWNRKGLQIGGGGYNGRLVEPDTLRVPNDGATPTPLARGYATFGSDGGHEQPDGKFALNDETFGNYAGAELKKTHDVALRIIKARYGALPQRTYFFGTSEGGREALFVAQRHPADYDGVIAVAPVYALTSEEIGNVLMLRRNFEPGGQMTTAKMTMLRNAVVAACDGLDGVKDGLVSAPDACRFDLAAVRCPSGGDTGETCLSDGQIATVKAIASPVAFDFPFSNGVTAYEAYPILKGGFVGFGTNAVPKAPASGGDPVLWGLGDVAVRWFILRDPMADLRTFNPDNYVDRIQHISALADATSTDLSAFQARGGKLILIHGEADTLVSSDNTVKYYRALANRYGVDTLGQFMRFYLIPGYAHLRGDPFNASWDVLGNLETWVEKGEAPRNIVMKDVAKDNAVIRSRPACPYPTYARYVGTGDVNAASSFACSYY